MKAVIKSVFVMIFSAGSIFAQDQGDQIQEMQYLLEEEKLAKEVYAHFYEMYGIKIFNNIASSEQRHMEMVQSLLIREGSEFIPLDEKGKFYSKELQQLFDDLIKRGEQSQKTALEVGKLIEETDIKDLTKARENTDSDFKKNMYSKLIKASQNHLNAFNRWLAME